MANDTQITIIGNLTADPDLRYTQGGDAVANFTIASTPSKFDKQTNKFEDGEALFLRCSIWRDYAEHVASSMSKGMRVIAQGNLVQRSYETKEGEKRTSIELQVTEIGPSLRYAIAQVTRQQRQDGAQGGQQGGWPTGGASQGSRPSGGQQTPSQAQGRYDEEPPF
ncbi:single-stranded DNA-binding protein [Gulosibacter massiliensis]|uniref:single-stranded DNA-binding protein n=1 Tax=Gulosibacter massiliensis TaxID=2479839 RepID=UPI000F62F6AF|nr:single-stranded DNA-binding protein [Gulosibacter massiliensis]